MLFLLLLIFICASFLALFFFCQKHFGNTRAAGKLSVNEELKQKPKSKSEEQKPSKTKKQANKKYENNINFKLKEKEVKNYGEMESTEEQDEWKVIPIKKRKNEQFSPKPVIERAEGIGGVKILELKFASTPSSATAESTNLKEEKWENLTKKQKENRKRAEKKKEMKKLQNELQQERLKKHKTEQRETWKAAPAPKPAPYFAKMKNAWESQQQMLALETKKAEMEEEEKKQLKKVLGSSTLHPAYKSDISVARSEKMGRIFEEVELEDDEEWKEIEKKEEKKVSLWD